MDNIEALRRLALQYEDACTRLHSAASLGGLLLWLSDLENNEKDMQATSPDADTVEVLTYHKSKGLEWPATICHSLENRLRAEVWGFDIVPQTEVVDLNNLLGNRLLRYWVNPYGDQVQRTPLEERLKAGPEQAAITRRALREEARLLYVGLTRARDYLVFPTVNRPPKWLNRVWHDGNEDYPVLDPTTSETLWEWEGTPLLADTEILAYPKDFTHAELPDDEVLYLENRQGKTAHPEAYIDPRREAATEGAGTHIVRPVYYGKEMVLPAEADRYTVAKAIKSYLSALHTDYPAQEQELMAQYAIARYCPDEGVEAGQLLQCGRQWMSYLEQEFRPRAMHRKYPVMLEREGRFFSAVLDTVLDTDAGWVIIQNSSFD
ncbi:MAG TPA: 3'-5' exonuclease, partial [Saprospiraceae bacterium]|nr:3'-5' exonuclease [Saprospiraceae bacterium]